jgi:hypothetical protein
LHYATSASSASATASAAGGGCNAARMTAEVIQRTSALILSAIETPAAAAEQTEADPEPALAQAS